MRWNITAVLVAISCPVVCLGQALANHVPADAIIYMGWNGADAPGAGYEKSHLKAVLDASQLPQFFSQSIPLLMAHIVQQNPESAVQVAAATKALTLLVNYWKYPVAIYVGGVDPANMGMPKIAVLCDAGADAANLSGQISAMIMGSGMPIRCVASDSLVIVSDFDYPTSVAGPLSQDANFTRLVGGMSKDPVAVFYLDGEAAMGAVDQLVQLHAPPDFQQHWQEIRQASGLAGLKHLVCTSGFEGRNWVTQSFLDAPAPRQGLLAMGNSEPMADELLQRIPQTSTLVQAGSFDLNGFYGFVEKLVEQLAPDGGAQFHQGVQMANGMLGMDLQKDLLAAFGKQWAVYTDPATEGDGMMGMVVLNRPADPQKLGDSLHRLETMANMLLQQATGGKVTLEFRHETVAGTEMSYFAAPFVSPTWAISDGTVYMGLYPQVVASALARPADAKSILANEAFAGVRQTLGAPDKVNFIIFNDLPHTAPQGYQSVLMISRLYLGIGDLFGGQTPALVMPTWSQLAPEIEPSGAFGWSDDAGVHAKFVTPFPGAEILSTGNLEAIYVGESAMMASVMLPSLNRPRGTANKVKSANNLKQIGLAIALYCNDNRGKYPPDLGTLVKTEDITAAVFCNPSGTTAAPPGMTADQAADWVNSNSDYVYIGAGMTNSAPPDRVVAYEKDNAHGGDGINLLFADGHVEFDILQEAHAQIDASKKARGL